MAVNSQSRGIASFGKRFVDRIWSGSSRDPSQFPSSPISAARGVHVSVYDKNPDDQVRPSVVPDDVIQPQSDQYWAPHPQTGVFGPATEHKGPASGERVVGRGNGSGGETVLEQQAWFRPLEDVEKPRS